MDQNPINEPLAAPPAPSLPVARLIAPPMRAFTAPCRLVDAATSPPRPWGPWASLGWFVLGIIVEGIAVIPLLLIIGVILAMQHSGPSDHQALRAFLESGLFLFFSGIVSTPVGLVYLVLIIHSRGWRARDYLAISPTTIRQTLGWLGAVLAYMVLSDTVKLLLGRDIVPPFMVEAYKTAGFVPLPVVAVVILAPLLKESFCRGFLYRGLAASRLGPAGAIAITAVLWSIQHVQYDWYGIAEITVGGVLLGLARHRTGSVVPPVLMHMLVNVGATIEVMVKCG